MSHVRLDLHGATNFIIQGERVRDVCIAFCSCQGSISARSYREEGGRRMDIGYLSTFPRADLRSADFGLYSRPIPARCDLTARQRIRLVITIYTLFPKYPRYRPGETKNQRKRVAMKERRLLFGSALLMAFLEVFPCLHLFTSIQPKLSSTSVFVVSREKLRASQYVSDEPFILISYLSCIKRCCRILSDSL